MNYFDPKSAAERYAKGRPDFHSNTIKHIAAFLKIRKTFDNVLDVACGTGLSTKALLEIAANVYGTDISAEMLSHAALANKIHYSVAPAEKLPFENNLFDLVTVSSGVHWFDIERFLAEVHRVLKSRAWLVLYENHFIAEMDDNENFKTWFFGVYLKKFSSPPRNNKYDWTNSNLHPKNLAFIEEERFKNAIAFTKQQLILYFTTQSNIISAVEKKETTYEEVEHWLDKELSPFYRNEITRTINYGNWIKYIQRLT